MFFLLDSCFTELNKGNLVGNEDVWFTRSCLPCVSCLLRFSRGVIS